MLSVIAILVLAGGGALVVVLSMVEAPETELAQRPDPTLRSGRDTTTADPTAEDAGDEGPEDAHASSDAASTVGPAARDAGADPADDDPGSGEPDPAGMPDTSDDEPSDGDLPGPGPVEPAGATDPVDSDPAEAAADPIDPVSAEGAAPTPDPGTGTGPGSTTAPPTARSEQRAAPTTRPVPAAAAPRTAARLPGPVRVESAKGVPRAHVALEGTWSELRVPWWRRILSLGAIAAIVAIVGVVLAGLIGLIVGLAAEVLTGSV